MNRDEIEARLARLLGRELHSELNRLMSYLGDPPRLENVPAEYWQNGWRGIQREVEPVLLDTFLASVDDTVLRIGIGVDLDNINHQAVNWARTHTEEVLRGMWQGRKDITTEMLRGTRQVGEIIAQGYEEGLTIREISERLQRLYSPVRAEMIAITETTRAVVEGEKAYVEELERETGQKMIPIWMTANDELVCPICRPRNGKPITNNKFPPAHPRCLPGDTLVLPGGRVSAGSKRWYEGNVVTIETLENQLTVTPNHPILTDSGWIPAGKLVKGDKVLAYTRRDWESMSVGVNNEKIITTIKDIFASLDFVKLTVSVDPSDFHNDGTGSKIAVILSSPKLNDSISDLCVESNPANSKLVSESIFGFPFQITLQEVIDVRYGIFTGHVYNLQTESEIYAANGIITHNCRCGVGWEFPKEPR